MTIAKLRPELEHLRRPLTDVQPWPGNPRRGDLDAIAASLAGFGQYQPLIAQTSTGRLVVGNNRYLAARDVLGWTDMAIDFIDVDDDTAARMLAADNRLSDLGQYDNTQLSEWLAALSTLDDTGWTEDDLDALLAAAESLIVELPAAAAPDNRTPWVPDDHDDDGDDGDDLDGDTLTLPPPRNNVTKSIVVPYADPDDLAELHRLLGDAKKIYGDDPASGEVLLRAMRLLLVVFDGRDDAASISMAALCRHAGL